MKFLIEEIDPEFTTVDPTNSLWSGWFTTAREALTAPIEKDDGAYEDMHDFIYRRVPETKATYIIHDNGELEKVDINTFANKYPEEFI